MTQEASLPGEGPSIPGRCNYDTLSPLIAQSNQYILWSLGCSSAQNPMPIMIKTTYQRWRKGISHGVSFCALPGLPGCLAMGSIEPLAWDVRLRGIGSASLNKQSMGHPLGCLVTKSGSRVDLRA